MAGTIILIISCISTIFITSTSIEATLSNNGLWNTPLVTTPIIILLNVIIFISVPQLSIRMERHHTLSAQHMHMLYKMFFFQVATHIATLHLTSADLS